MASQWGMGLLANSGEYEPAAFADATHGDISNRALFITRPLGFLDGAIGENLLLMVGGDLVERDELTTRSEGDTTLQGVGAVVWKTEPLEVGTYTAYRTIDSSEGFLTSVLANDLYTRWTRTFWRGRHTSIGDRMGAPSRRDRGAPFLGAPYPSIFFQFGGAARAEWTPASDGILGSFTAGWAPGDNAPGMERREGFADPGFKAGMILFEDVLAHLSAQAHDNASDPELLAVPLRVSNAFLHQQFGHNSIFLFPQGRVQRSQRATGRSARSSGGVFQWGCNRSVLIRFVRGIQPQQL